MAELRIPIRAVRGNILIASNIDISRIDIRVLHILVNNKQTFKIVRTLYVYESSISLNPPVSVPIQKEKVGDALVFPLES